MALLNEVRMEVQAQASVASQISDDVFALDEFSAEQVANVEVSTPRVL